MSRRFAVFILTHNRPYNLKTLKMLERQGYTGELYILCDNEDASLPKYKELYGDKVIVFDKAAVHEYTDMADNFPDRRTVLLARNACFDIAQEMGLDYFVELDDDYGSWYYKFGANLEYLRRERQILNLDKMFGIILDFLEKSGAHCVATAQNGDFIGGEKGTAASKVWIKRKVMNTFFCSTKRPFRFTGRLNDDISTCVPEGNRGKLFFTFFNLSVVQTETQSNAGGMTDPYLDYGTYVKSFYSVMYTPSCVKISEIGYLYRRIHHKILWSKAVPRILEEKYRKRSQVD